MDEPHSPHQDLGAGQGRDAPSAPDRSWGEVAVRVVAGVVSVTAVGLWLICVVGVLRSRFATETAVDPHGYTLIFGTVLAVPVGLVAALALPFAFPRRARARAFGIVMPSFVIVSVLLVVALLTA